MPLFQIIDLSIKANCGMYFGSDETDAKDLAVAPAGWSSYAEYLAADAKFNGTRGLEAIRIVVWQS